MTATPDSFSTADLEALLKDAPKDITDLPVEETSAEETRSPKAPYCSSSSSNE